MLTDKTQKAIGILHEIAYYGTRSYSDKGAEHACNPFVYSIFWDSCWNCRFHTSVYPEEQPDAVQSYRLCKELSEISLFQLLIAIGEGINPVVPSADEDRIYKHFHYGMGASKLGVINQMLCTMLRDVNLLDL